jgi:hypothetical protein
LKSVTPCRQPLPLDLVRPPSHRLAILLGALLCVVATSSASAQSAGWEQWQHLVGVADVGVRSDGSLMAMANARLYQISPSTGAITPYASAWSGGGAPDAEYYFSLTPAQAVDGTSCSFAADDLYILDLVSPPAVVRVDAAGRPTRIAELGSVDTLGGITVDTVGSFGHRVLVTGTRDNKTTLFAIDCDGKATTITASAPLVEGGIAVAPSTFGAFGGQLIAPDENSGQLWAIDASGRATLVVVPSLPTGGDTGVESVGFVPPGFSAGAGYAYLADRGTPNNPFPGNDSLLRLPASTLSAAGVQDGDLLVSTEGGGTTIAIHCADTCQVLPVSPGPSGGHIEGHIVLAPTP